MNDIREYVKFFSACRIENRIYFFNMTFNGVFYLDLIDLSVHFVHKVSYEPVNKILLSVAHCFADGNVVYFFPHFTNVIMKYDVLKWEEQIINIPDFNGKYFETLGFVHSYNKVYMFPNDLKKGVYVLDLQSQIVEKDKDLSILFSKFSNINLFIVQESHVLINESGDNKIIEVDIVARKIIRIDNLQKDIHIFDILYDGNHYWILQKEETDIYEWDRKNDLFQKYINENAEWDTRQFEISPPYSNMVFLEDETLVLNHCIKNILRINRKKKTIESPITFPKGFRPANRNFAGWPICNSYFVFEDKVLLYPCRGNMLLIYDKKTKQLTGKEMTVSDEDVPFLFDIVYEMFLKGGIHMERSMQKTLDQFVNYMQIIPSGKTQCSEGNNIGKFVYHKVKKIL